MPIGAHGTLKDDQVTLQVMVADDDLGNVRFERLDATEAEIQDVAIECARRFREDR